MVEKIVVIISTSDLEKAHTAAMYVKNALFQGWIEEVKIFFFGPAQDLLLEDKELQAFVEDVRAMKEIPIACKFISERDLTSEKLSQIGVKVESVGFQISELIKNGYVPMVW